MKGNIIAVFAHPENGTDIDHERNRMHHLVVGVPYKVMHKDVGDFNTTITIMLPSGKIAGRLNSVCFDFFVCQQIDATA